VKIKKSLKIISSPFIVESWCGSESPMQMDPTIQNLKNSTHPPLAPSRFRHVSVTVSYCLPFRFVRARSECHSGFYFVTALLHFLVVPFRFCYISDFLFTFPLHPISGFVSLLLQLHYSFFLTPFVLFHLHYSSLTLFQFCYNYIHDPFWLQRS
jgi:hypothetical protein